MDSLLVLLQLHPCDKTAIYASKHNIPQWAEVMVGEGRIQMYENLSETLTGETSCYKCKLGAENNKPAELVFCLYSVYMGLLLRRVERPDVQSLNSHQIKEHSQTLKPMKLFCNTQEHQLSLSGCK